MRQCGGQVIWLGTRRGLEAAVVPKEGIAIHFIHVSGLRGKRVTRWFKAPFELLLALLQSLVIVLRCWPNAVLGMGGFVTGPGGVAAWLLRRPLLIHEQNAVPGLTNQLLARFAVRVMEAFPGSFPSRYLAHHTGNPVREQLLSLPPPEQRLAGRQGNLRLLVLGGSQGAQALNDLVPAALAAMKPPKRLEVWHQAGAHNLRGARASYEAVEVRAQVVSFIEQMDEAYGWADLVVSRAGAMTVCELAAVGVASILVPFPYAVDDHQTFNARYLANAGAAILVPQADLSVARLSSLFSELSSARKRVLAMARAARELAVPDATRRVANLCVEAAGA
jgi:UDP-N-acetylglucosamine--N-acetylmuramyl-(pentapeptide) pyrophosphoryl-undecaprenol N-acetylglucosamine transferase